MFFYPFDSLPPLECRISPPLVVIDGPKLGDLDLDAISLMYHRQESSETQVATKEHLVLLCSVWDLMKGAKDPEKNWGDHKRMVGKGYSASAEMTCLSSLPAWLFTSRLTFV